MRTHVPPFAPAALGTALALSLLLGGCATGPQSSPTDPFEPVNRAIFTVNDKADKYVAVPIAKGYQFVTPQPVRTGISNFFSNIGDVGNFANNVLQGQGVAAAESFMRVAVNTVLGLGGLLDIATEAGIDKHSQDFGLTLGKWGFPAGPYLVLPLFGPSSIRDGVGFGVNTYFSPIPYFEPAVRNSMFGANFVSTRANLLGATDILDLAALDRYSFVRDAYLQRREYLLRGAGDRGNLPNYDDDDEGAGVGAAGAAGTAAGATGAAGTGGAAVAPAAPATPTTPAK